jgi:aspartate/methionine/tyrosine aminotransferase
VENPRLAEVWAPYMEWAKRHPRPRFDLCGSNLLGCTIDDLPGGRDIVAPNGDNDHGYAPLIEAIADFYGTTIERVALASGASGANFLVLAALLAPGDEVLVERPAYDPLPGAARLLGATVRRFERSFDDGFRVDPDAVAAALTPATRLVVVTHPHNPSGAALDDTTLDALGDLGERHGVYVMVDEVYLDTLTPRPAPAATRSDRLISTSSLTKSYGLAGLRAGWVLAAPEVAVAVRRVRGTTEAIGAFPGEQLAWVAFQNIEALTARARAILVPGSTIISDFVAQRRELDWVPPSGGTVAFPRLQGHDDAGPFIERLLAEFGTAVVPGRFFEAPAHFRIAFGGDPGALAGGLEQLGRALDLLGS